MIDLKDSEVLIFLTTRDPGPRHIGTEAGKAVQAGVILSEVEMNKLVVALEQLSDVVVSSRKAYCEDGNVSGRIFN